MIPFRKVLLTLLLIWVPVLANASEVAYTILLENGVKAGHQIVKRHGNKVDVSFDFKENGRGPTLKERIILAFDGTIKNYRVSGTSEMGGEVSERFTAKNNLIQWHSNSENGSKKINQNGFYIPMNSSWEVNSLMITALSKSKNNYLPLLPSGGLKQQVLDEIVVKKGSLQQNVKLVMQVGIGLKPDFFWATTGKIPRLFAAIIPGYSYLIEKGWEDSLKSLSEKQNLANQKILYQKAQQLQHPINGPLLIKNIRLFDSENAFLTEPHDVLIENKRIVKITSVASIVEFEGDTIDGSGKTLLPGLFDMHTHINKWSGLYHLSAGVTTVRDMGNSNTEVQEIISDSTNNQLLFPHIIPAGFIEGKSEYSSSDGIMIENLAQVKESIDWYFEHGYRHIKIYSSFPKDLVRETSAYAHEKGMTVGGHVPGFMKADEAIDSGFNELNHINQVVLNFLSDNKTDTRTLERFYLPAEQTGSIDFDSQEVKAFIELLIDKKITIDPTLSAFDFIKQKDGEMADPFASIAEHLPPDLQRSFKTGTMNIPNTATANRYKHSYNKMIEFVGLLHKNGVSLVAGTDTLAGFGLHSELELYVKAGISPAEALQIATWNGAKVSKILRDRGSIEVNKLADLIIVDGDPTTNIEDIRKISTVITNGKVIYPHELHVALGVKPFVSDSIKTALQPVTSYQLNK
ncbi:amidohydrolase family protein [Polynucleobacter paneuropaeus]|nr:amidohydrolase family protein [Polynucleobacter paneuropaeus]